MLIKLCCLTGFSNPEGHEGPDGKWKRYVFLFSWWKWTDPSPSSSSYLVNLPKNAHTHTWTHTQFHTVCGKWECEEFSITCCEDSHAMRSSFCRCSHHSAHSSYLSACRWIPDWLNAHQLDSSRMFGNATGTRFHPTWFLVMDMPPVDAGGHWSRKSKHEREWWAEVETDNWKLSTEIRYFIDVWKTGTGFLKKSLKNASLF